jgi:dipeptidyl-peptidase-4
MLRRASRTALVAALCTAIALPALAQQSAQRAETKPRLSLEQIYASGLFSPDYFRGGSWAEAGPVIRYIEGEGDATHLVEFNLETEESTRLIDGSTLRAPDTGRLIQIEDYAYSADGDHVLLYTDSERVWRQNTKGFYYLADLETGEVTPISDREAGFQMFAKLSPSGDRVAFVRERDLFVVDLATMTETQITSDGSEGGIINGTFDWVYEEEFGLRDGWKWSPDGRYIAFFKLDETNTRDFEMADLRGQYPEQVRFRYPKAGEVNSEVKIGVVDTETGHSIRYFDTGTWGDGADAATDVDAEEYLARMGWTPTVDGQHRVWMFRLDRDQNDLDLLYGDPATGTLETVLVESEPTWIDVETDKLTYLPDGEHFMWQSETSGYKHLDLYRVDGTKVGAITSGEYDVDSFLGYDDERGLVFFMAAKDGGALGMQFYAVPVSLERGATGEPVLITEESGTHRIDLSDDFRYAIHTHSTADAPPVITLAAVEVDVRRGTLRSASLRTLDTLVGNERLRETLARYDLPKPEFMTVPDAEGGTLNAWMLRPTDFDESREYPVLMYVYGGPGSQTVLDSWGGQRYLWHSYLAQELGMIVVSVDNRGTGARGKAFKSAPYERLGLVEAADQQAAARHLADLPYVDAERIGIWGWSYGGYMALLGMLTNDGPNLFHLGVSVAPVTDWRQYDTIYTERYMSTPQANPEGYRVTAPVTYAERLQPDQDLLIIHGDADDNVHFQNAVQMVDALIAANKQFDFMMYPGRNHGIYGGITRLHLFTMVTDYLEENL